MVNLFKAYLSVALDAGGSETTISVDRITTLTGETVETADFADFARGILTVNPDGDGQTSYPEYISFTAVSGLTFTGAVRGLSSKDNSVVTDNKRFHPVGTPVVISFGVHNIQDLIDYIDAAVVGGIGTADRDTAGSTKLSEDLSTKARAMAVLVTEQSVPDMTLSVKPFSTVGPGGIVTFAGGNTGTMSAPSGNPRIDLIVYNIISAALAVRTGTEGASPSAPASSWGDIVLAEVYHRVGETSIKDEDDSTNGFIQRWYQISLTTSLRIPGEVTMWPVSSIPSGWLLCNGQAVSRTTYARLFGVIGTDYGTGDGSTTFNVPDFTSRTAVGAGQGTKVLTFASRSSDTLTVTGSSNFLVNEIQTGQAIVYHTSGTVITGLSNDTTYYIIRVAYNQFKLASSLANAQNGTAITLSGDGTGTQTFTITFINKPIASPGGQETHAMSISELLAHTHTEVANTTSPVAGGPPSPGGNIFAPGNTGSTGGNAAMNIMQPFITVNFIIKT